MIADITRHSIIFDKIKIGHKNKLILCRSKYIIRNGVVFNEIRIRFWGKKG